MESLRLKRLICPNRTVTILGCIKMWQLLIARIHNTYVEESTLCTSVYTLQMHSAKYFCLLQFFIGYYFNM